MGWEDNSYDGSTPDTSYYPSEVNMDFGNYYDTPAFDFTDNGFQFSPAGLDWSNPDLLTSLGVSGSYAPSSFLDQFSSPMGLADQLAYQQANSQVPSDIATYLSQAGLDPAASRISENGFISTPQGEMTPEEVQMMAQKRAEQVAAMGRDQVAAMQPENIYSSGIYGNNALGGETVNPLWKQSTTEQELIDNLSARDDLAMADKIKLLQDMKVMGGFVEPDTYSPESAVVSPDEYRSGEIPMWKKLLGGVASAIKPGQGAKTYRRNADGSVTETTASESSPLAKLVQAYAIMKGGGGQAPAAVGDRSAQSWSLSRKAGSGRKMASGGSVSGNGSSAGALGLLRGGSTGQKDDVPANLSHGEYVMDADVVSALGDGNTEAGAAKLDQMRAAVREHKRSAPADKIPPKAKSPLQYMKGAK